MSQNDINIADGPRSSHWLSGDAGGNSWQSSGSKHAKGCRLSRSREEERERQQRGREEGVRERMSDSSKKKKMTIRTRQKTSKE